MDDTSNEDQTPKSDQPGHVDQPHPDQSKAPTNDGEPAQNPPIAPPDEPWAKQ